MSDMNNSLSANLTSMNQESQPPGLNTVPGLQSGQAAQGLEAGGVWPLASEAGHLEDEGHSRKPGVVEERPEALLADLALTQVGVAVSVGAEPGLGVVAVDHLQPLNSDHPVPLVQGRGHGLGSAQVVPGGEGVAGVEAGPYPGVADRVDHGP